jgi:RsiW-degrading membrane proteinase PrsW (M82 family)
VIIAYYASLILPLSFLIVVSAKESRQLLVFFAWGLSAALLVYGLGEYLDSLLNLGELQKVGLVFPAMEEVLKILPLLVLTLLNRSKPLARGQITRLAMASGIGFAILENMLYLSLLGERTTQPLVFMILRSITACLMHGALTSLLAMALDRSRGLRGMVAFSLFGGLLLAAIAIHGCFNLFPYIEGYEWVAIVLPLLLFAVQLFMLDTYQLAPFAGAGAQRRNTRNAHT